MTMQTGRRTSSSRNTPAPLPASSGYSVAPPPSHFDPPRFITFVGVGFVILWVVALMTQIQTNEAFITNAGQVNVYRPNWEILWQPIALILGDLPPQEAIATLFGWGIELIYLGFVAGYELVIHAVFRASPAMAKLFRGLSWVIIGFNMWTDYNYGSLSTAAWGHVAFAIITSFIVGFFGTIGLALLEKGWERA